MKTKSIIATLILSTIVSSVVSAQEITPNVVQEGRVWSLYKAGSTEFMDGFTGINHGMFFGADTLIDGKTYKKMLYRRVFHWENFNELPSYDWGCAMREEGSKVYHYDYKLGKERLMFDFALKPGDTIETYSKFLVTEVGFTEGETPLYRIRLRCLSFENFDDEWIEKVGSKISGIYWDNCWGCAGGWNDLTCCKNKYDEEPFFFGKYFPECLSAEYTTVQGVISFVALENLDSTMAWAVIDNTDTHEYAQKYTTLMRNSTPFSQRLVVDGVEYLAGDKVEITGWISTGYRFSDLEILSIKMQGNVGIEPSQKAELRISPNPAKETITLRATGCNLQKVEILDVNGRVLHAATLNGTETFDYNVSQMPSGFYLARVKTSCGVFTEKFSVK